VLGDDLQPPKRWRTHAWQGPRKGLSKAWNGTAVREAAKVARANRFRQRRHPGSKVEGVPTQ
jgi:hypothetical protein